MDYQIPIDFIPLNVVVYRYECNDFIFIDLNKHAEKTERLKKETLLGKKLCDIFPAVKEFGLYDVLLRVYERGGHETFEDAHYQDERISGWRKNEVISLPNGDVMALYEDMTQAKQLEEENHRHLEQVKMLAQAIEQTSDLVKIINTKGEILFVNDSLITHSGYSRFELIGAHTRIFKSGYHNKSFYTHLWKTVTSGNSYADTFINKNKDGTICYEEETITPIFDENGKIAYYVSTGKDISTRVALENALRESEALYHTLFDLSPVGILVIDPDTSKAVEFNSISHKALGYTAEEFSKLRVTDYEVIETAEDTKAHIEALKNGISEIFETQHRAKNGEIRDVVISVQLIRVKEKPYLFSVYHDITSLKQYERALEIAKKNVESANKSLTEQAKLLEEYAFLDPLTHLFNRRKFDKVFDTEWRRALRNHEALSLCMIDIDFFKSYNDSLGHDEGDICLQQVASAISKSSSRGGELAVRYGGEEFMVLLPHCDEQNAYQSGENIRRSVEALEIRHPRSEVSSIVTCSVGCATVYPAHKTLDKKGLIKRADEALYKAKQNGRNRIETINEEFKYK